MDVFYSIRENKLSKQNRNAKTSFVVEKSKRKRKENAKVF